MKSKIEAAKIVVRSGIPLVIASGRQPGILARILSGAEVGTLFPATHARLAGRKRWIAFFHHPQGVLQVDDGAREALRHGGKSLLPPGVVYCEGNFSAGDVVRLCDLDGMEFARGIAKLDAGEIRSQIQTRGEAGPQKTLARVTHEEIIHRDDLVIL